MLSLRLPSWPAIATGVSCLSFVSSGLLSAPGHRFITQCGQLSLYNFLLPMFTLSSACSLLIYDHRHAAFSSSNTSYSWYVHLSLSFSLSPSRHEQFVFFINIRLPSPFLIAFILFLLPSDNLESTVDRLLSSFPSAAFTNPSLPPLLYKHQLYAIDTLGLRTRIDQQLEILCQKGTIRFFQLGSTLSDESIILTRTDDFVECMRRQHSDSLTGNVMRLNAGEEKKTVNYSDESSSH